MKHKILGGPKELAKEKGAQKRVNKENKRHTKSPIEQSPKYRMSFSHVRYPVGKQSPEKMCQLDALE